MKSHKIHVPKDSKQPTSHSSIEILWISIASRAQLPKFHSLPRCTTGWDRRASLGPRAVGRPKTHSITISSFFQKHHHMYLYIILYIYVCLWTTICIVILTIHHPSPLHSSLYMIIYIYILIYALLCHSYINDPINIVCTTSVMMGL